MHDIYTDLENAIARVLEQHNPGKKSYIKSTIFNYGGVDPTFEIKGVLHNSIPKQITQALDPYAGLNPPTNNQIQTTTDHTGHDVVENTAGGITFKYCRNCKVEV
jgi:hypothetical protein